MKMKNKIIEETKSMLHALPNAFFDGAYLFYNATEYSMASELHTDTLLHAISCEDVEELPADVVQYQIHALTKEEYSSSILANSSVDIDDIWEDNFSHAIIVRAMVLDK